MKVMWTIGLSLLLWIAGMGFPFGVDTVWGEQRKDEDLFFFDRELHFCAVARLPRLYVEIRRVLPSGSHEWTEAWKTALGDLWSEEKIEVYGAGVLLNLPGSPPPEKIVATAAALRNRESIRFAYPLVETTAGPCVPLPRVEFAFDPRLSLQERDEICRAIHRDLLDLFGASWAGRVEKLGESKGIVLEVPDPFLVARRLALSQAKGIRWAIPVLNALRSPVEVRAALVRPGGEEGESMSVLLGNLIYLRLMVKVDPTAQVERDAPLRSISELSIRPVSGEALLPSFLERGEPREEGGGASRQVWLPLRFYRSGEFLIEPGTVAYREADNPIRSSQAPPLTLRVIGLASGVIALHPLKLLPGWVDRATTVREAESPGPWLMLSLGALLMAAGGGWIVWANRIRKDAHWGEPMGARASGDSGTILIRQARERWERERELASVRKLAWQLLEKGRSGKLSGPAQGLCHSLLEQSESLFADGALEESVGCAAERKVTELLLRLDGEAGEGARRG
ncbi:hypothetical protein [Methylacidimicrobium tartarophylax]|uniref:Uncharacterized protein n=1 Tax=Methylacidimicrobium tartarophylax TaxID=1041768 RepID=A0A5E6ME88_9BACT|nr:hypothetical protein [Methylacidimicrobium tartarophylax]VVM06571.1 hypothetical protein MAMT_01283 [Methylacidimicrobium tartarophylax]